MSSFQHNIGNLPFRQHIAKSVLHPMNTQRYLRTPQHISAYLSVSITKKQRRYVHSTIPLHNPCSHSWLELMRSIIDLKTEGDCTSRNSTVEGDLNIYMRISQVILLERISAEPFRCKYLYRQFSPWSQDTREKLTLTLHLPIDLQRWTFLRSCSW